MEFTSVRRVKIKGLDLPGDIKERMATKRVRELADSFQDTGGEPGNMPWIRNGTREVVAGRDRIAAAMLLKLTHLWVRTGDYTDEEAEKAELTENLRRRQDNREKMLAQTVRLEEQAIKAEEAAKEPGTDVPPKKDRKGTKARARERVAAKAHVKPESVRKAEQRQKAKEAPPKPEKPPIDTFGLELSKGLASAVQKIQEACSTVEGSARTISSALSRVANILPPTVLIRLQDQARSLMADAKAVRPTHLCPTCRGDGDDKCKLCKGAHYARHEQMADIPKEQLEHVKKSANGVQAEA